MNYYKSTLILLIVISVLTSVVRAETADELKLKISDRNDAISKLEAEIKQYQQQIDSIGLQKDSLSNALRSLDISRKKLEANTKLTQKKIDEKNSEIKILSSEIGDKSERILDGKNVISKSFTNIYQSNSISAIESILGQKSFSDIWENNDELIALQDGMQDRIDKLREIKSDLEQNKKLSEKKKLELVALTNDLKNQTKIIAETEREQRALLTETKNTEANYNRILQQRQAQKLAYEREVSDLESALQFTLNPNTIPNPGTGVLKWPVEKVRVTQYFGNTEFSTKNPSVYKGKGHNGIDFGASIGTKILASGSGVISEVIDTRSTQRCGYGKWIAVKHPNGLSTVYAHLSLITVTKGQSVAAGQVIGYSGNTGYTTGPHLHFGVYVTEGLQTIASKSCPGIIIPYAAYNAYLNPLSFL